MNWEDDDGVLGPARTLLAAVRTLHVRGAHRIQIFPHMAASGMYWRCPIVIDGVDPFSVTSKELNYSSGGGWELPGCSTSQPISYLKAANRLWAALTEEQRKRAVVPDPDYVRWYAGLLAYLCDDEIPYLFGDDYGPSPLDSGYMGVMGQTYSHLRNDYGLPPGNSLAWH